MIYLVNFYDLSGVVITLQSTVNVTLNTNSNNNVTIFSNFT